MEQITLFSLFPQDLTRFPKSQRSANDRLNVSISTCLPGRWDATYQNPNPPGETTTLNRTGTPESRSMRRISVPQLFLPSLAKHLLRVTIHHKSPPPRPWCASDLWVGVWMWVATETSVTPSSIQKRGDQMVTYFSIDSLHPLQNH